MRCQFKKCPRTPTPETAYSTHNIAYKDLKILNQLLTKIDTN